MVTLNEANIARYRANLRAAWDKADAEWLARGYVWYDEQILVVMALGAKVGMDKRMLMGITATLSIDNTWPRNLAALGMVIDAIAVGEPLPVCCHRYGTVRAKVQAILNGADPEWVSDNYGKGSRSFKVKRFYANFMGDTSVATIDRWANRLCEGRPDDTALGVPTGRDYLEKEAAYQREAEAMGLRADGYQGAQWSALLKELGYVA